MARWKLPWEAGGGSPEEPSAPEPELDEVADQDVPAGLGHPCDSVYPKCEIRIERDIRQLMVELKALRRLRHQKAGRQGRRGDLRRPEWEELA